MAISGIEAAAYLMPPAAPLVRLNSGRPNAAFSVFANTHHPLPASGHRPSTPLPNLKPLKSLATAAGYLLAALMLRRFPSQATRFKWISPDWKDWAKIALGIGIVNQVNRAANRKPPTWLNAIETVAVVNPLMLGWAGLRQIPAMATLVAGLVTGTNYLSDRAEPLAEQYLNLPDKATRAALSAVATVLGVASYPWMARSGVMGSAIREKAALSQGASAASVICARCGGAHVLCMTDIGEFLGAMGNWLHLRHKETRPS